MYVTGEKCKSPNITNAPCFFYGFEHYLFVFVTSTITLDILPHKSK